MHVSETLKKNLLFSGLVTFGIVSLVYFLLPGTRVSTPASYQTNWYEQDDVQKLIYQIDQEFSEKWEKENIESAPETGRLRLIRRISLGLIGTVPSLEELRAIEAVPEDQQVNWWISRLLDDKRCSDYLAERLARAYVGTEDGPFVIFRRRRFVTWLSDQLHDNTGYDKIVRKLFSDQGIWTDTPAVNFVTVTIDDETGQPDPIRLAGRTTRAFLGMRIDCLQCHDDFLGNIELGNKDDVEGGAQTHFHQLAAFFAQVQNSIGGVRDNLQSEPYRYTYLNENKETVVQPTVPYGEQMLPVDENLRKQLTMWMTNKDNRPFARAIVNRMWAIVCGQSLVQPVDNLPLHGPFPPGMETLVDDFVAHDFDLKRLLRVIVGTKVFRLDSQVEFEVTSAHKKHWSVFPVTRLRPEQVAGAIIQSTSLTTIDSTASVFRQIARFGQEFEFVERYGDWGEDEFVPRGATVTQRLLMMNGDMVNNRLNEAVNSPVQAANFSPDIKTIIDNAFLSTLTRYPNEIEAKYFCQRVDESKDDGLGKVVQDLYWTLINRSEFSWNQ